MGLTIGTMSSVVPLTAEIFGENGDLVLEGQVEQFGYIPEEMIEIGLALKESGPADPLYTHPTIFQGLRWDANSSYKVRLHLKDGRIVMRVLTYTYEELSKSPTFLAEPVKMATCNFKVIHELFTTLERVRTTQINCCYNREKCLSKWISISDHRNWALVVIGFENTHLMCRKCYEALVQQHPILENLPSFTSWEFEELRRKGLPVPYIKGWEIPPNAPVPIWNIPPLEVQPPTP